MKRLIIGFLLAGGLAAQNDLTPHESSKAAATNQQIELERLKKENATLKEQVRLLNQKLQGLSAYYSANEGLAALERQPQPIVVDSPAEKNKK